MHRHRHSWPTLVLLAGSLLPFTVTAQESGGRSLALEDVVVTARKVEERLQDTPLAVSAFTENDMKVRNMVNVTDVASAAPNVTIGKGGFASGASNNPVVFIRGIGMQDFLPTIDPAVGIYIDGVYLGRNVGNLVDLVDLERAEVLRGPQGTLFGRNTIGGALNLISAKPREEFDANVEVTGGEDSQLRLRGMVNVPITDRVFGRLSGFLNQRDGYVDLINYDDVQYGEEDSWTLRGQLRVLATDSITIDLSADYTEQRETGAPLVLEATDPSVAVGLPSGGLIHNGILTGGACGAVIDPPPPPIILSSDPVAAATNPACYGDVWLPPNRFSNAGITQNFAQEQIEPESNFDIWGVHLNVDWDLTPTLTLTSITAARGFSSDMVREGDGSPLIILQNNVESTYTQDQQSQELQLSGISFDDRLNWVAGLYYFRERASQRAGVLAAAAFLNPATAPPPVGSGQAPVLRTRDARQPENTSIAAFAQGTWSFTEQWHLTLGLRYTDEEKDYFLWNQFLPAQGLEGTITTEEWNPHVALRWDFTDYAMTYLSFTQGFRNGGFPGRISTAISDLGDAAFGEEFVDSYEWGLKGTWLDNRLQTNLALFYMQYEDIQIDATLVPESGVIGTTVPSIFNAGDADYTGAELEVKASLTDRLLADLSLGYLDAEFDRVDPRILVDTVIINEDNKLPYTPEWQWNLGLSYDLPLGSDRGSLFTRIDWYYTDDQWYTVGNFDDALQEAYSVVNANITYIFPDERWEVAVGVENLGDEEYFTNGIRLQSNCSCTMNVMARPRHWYGQVRYSFGAR